jgi:uncharacterized protein (TIGR02596 family)
MNAFAFHRGKFRGAFTLLELLTVMAIMGILLYLAVPASVSLQQSSNLSLAGQVVADQIAVAREMAASSNRTVEIRFVSPTTWSALGSPNYTGYHALQLWAPNEAGVSSPADRLITLPDGVEISVNSTLSPLLSTPASGYTAATMPSGATAGSTYVPISIRPTGTVLIPKPPTVTSSTSEDNANNRAPYYFLTILPVRYDSATTVPKNYSMLQVNPDTGRTQTYRP